MTSSDPIIVGGFYRSGTSLLRRMLDAHSSIHCGPEVKFFRDFYGDYTNDDLAHIRFFATVRALDLPEPVLLETFGRALIETYEQACRHHGKRRWADKNPENLIYLDQWSTLLTDRFAFIHVVREPLDALASLRDTPFPKTVPPDLPSRIQLYRVWVGHGVAFARAHPDRSHRVRYEDLVADPTGALQTLTEFLGEPFEENMLTNALDGARPGIEDPKVSRTAAVHADSVGRGAEVMSTADAARVRSELGDLLGELGYDD